MKKMSKTQRLIKAAGHEIKEKEPAIVGHTREKFGAKRAEAQKTAIMLDKARRAGADIPKKAKRTVHHSPTMTEIDCHKLYSMKPVR